MAKFTAALRALGILLGTWGLLFMVGAVAGVLPALDGAFGRTGRAARPAADAGVDDPAQPPSEPDTGEPSTDGSPAPSESPAPRPVAGATDPTPTDGTSPARVPGRAGTPIAPAEDAAPALAEPTAPALRRHTVCSGTDAPPVVDVVDPGNVVVGCGPDIEWLTRWPAGGDQLYRTLRVHREPAQPRARVRASAIAHGDVDGDGQVDLVLGFLEQNAEGSTVGGALYLVPASPGGGFAEPQELAPIPVTSIVLSHVNDHEALDIVALHRPDAFGRRPSEVWVFGGGTSPARTARLDAGNAVALAVADLDRDEHQDIVAGKAAGTARVFFGDGTGRFERQAEVREAPATELLSFDLDDDGGVDVLALAEQTRLIRAARAESLVSIPLDVAPGLHSATAVDLDGDGVRDLLGVAGDGLVSHRSMRGTALAPAALVDLPLHAGTPRMVWALRSSDGLGVVVLTRLPGDAEPFTLVLMTSLESVNVQATPTPVTDAPLTLRFDVH
ncbi:MAG: hypothetical protein R3B40_08010 [Polyangiales bacterium]